MFIGEYSHNLDEKGRLAIPAKLRALLTDGAVVTRGLDNCLFLYPKTEWMELAKKWASLPIMSQAQARDFTRLMISGAMDLDFDTQGRVNLPEYLRDFATLKKKVVVIGLYDHLEIWDEDKWKIYKANIENKSNDIAAGLKELGV